MRSNFPASAEIGREKSGNYATDTGCRFGKFFIRGPRGEILQIIASDGVDWPFNLPAWEHVSVILSKRCPTWEEMDFVKNLFFSEDECVMQLHPPRANWISHHPYCLHLWKPVGIKIPQPPLECVGPKP